MLIESNVDISSLSGLKTRALARAFGKVDSIDTLSQLNDYAKSHKMILTPIGEGANTLWGKNFIDRLISKIEIPGFEIFKRNSREFLIKVGAGENWDSVVEKTVELDLSGIEALSAIPGTAGAAPVQNIGAYGNELCETLESVSVYDLADDKVRDLSSAECAFGYRDSIFKNTAKDKLIITSITLRLSQNNPEIPQYKDTLDYFKDYPRKPNLKEIRKAVIEIRNKKLPSPKLIPNCGSFFKNPIVTPLEFEKLRKIYSDIPHFSSSVGMKIPAGWLIESVGLKGGSFGNLATYSKNALVLINTNGSIDFEEVNNAIQKINSQVFQRFGINLEPEPIIIN